MERKYKVGGMSCAACSARVERAVSSLDGVEVCSVNLLTAEMRVEGDVSASAVAEAVTRAGYTAKLMTDRMPADSEELRDNESPRQAFYICDNLTSVTFANPNGWWYASEATATSGTAISADSLSDASTAAGYLRSSYRNYYWFRTE